MDREVSGLEIDQVAVPASTFEQAVAGSDAAIEALAILIDGVTLCRHDAGASEQYPENYMIVSVKQLARLGVIESITLNTMDV